jgi:hypothetical protein
MLVAAPTTATEKALIAALRAIVIETMDYPPVPSFDSESYLPLGLIEMAQRALDAYGLKVLPNPAMMADGVPA